MDVAIKIETNDLSDEDRVESLPTEKHCYDDMGAQRKWHFWQHYIRYRIKLYSSDFSLVGIPQILYYGDHEDGDERIMVMEMLGPNLDKMFVEANLHFTIEKIHWIAKQLVNTSEIDCQCVN